MEGIKLPEFFNTEEKYNKMIHETNTLPKFEAIYMKLLSSEDLEMPAIFALMKVIKRDVVLVHKLTEASALMDMTETFIRYCLIKDEEHSEKEQQQQEQQKSARRKRKFGKDSSQKPKKQKIPVQVSEEVEEEEVKWECDCPHPHMEPIIE